MRQNKEKKKKRIFSKRITDQIIVLTATIDMPFFAWKQDLLHKEIRGQFNWMIRFGAKLTQIPALFIAASIADNYGIEWIFLYSFNSCFLKSKRERNY